MARTPDRTAERPGLAPSSDLPRSLAVTRILVFYPSNKRTVQLETTILAIHRRGIQIELLTTCEPGALHEFLSSQGVSVHGHPVSKRWSLGYYARQVAYLARFCHERGITTVFSNLQHANFIAVFAQYLCSARFVIFRHHFNFALPGEDIPLKPNRMERLFDTVINRLARQIVVPSSGVYEGMRAVEHADMSRVTILPYMYEFDRYGKPNPQAVESIRSRYPARLTLLMSSRLIPFKRHGLVFPIIRDLVAEGLDLRMFVLDDGPERERLEAFVRANQLKDRIIMLGFRRDFLDYMAASDLLVHPSLTDASSSVVKEIALLGKTVIACRGVGDFDDYLENGRNAFLVPRSTDGSEIAEILRDVYSEPTRLDRLGKSLRATVLERFSLKPESVDRYLELAECS
jgi:glycosyltransferase involved in cell wall biosynthesis